jgi:prepilin-type N-terminal cleavage/methylation domain-containing protein
MSNFPSKGFTLFEMLMVVFLVALIAAIAIPGYRKSKDYLSIQPVGDDIHTFLELGRTYSSSYNKQIRLLLSLSGTTANMSLFPIGNDVPLSTYDINPLILVETSLDIDEIVFSPTSSVTYKKEDTIVSSNANTIFSLSSPSGITESMTLFYESGQVQFDE